jgi:biopolymer transport protein ExbB
MIVATMMLTQLPPTASAASTLPTDLSPYGMFMAADNVVKAVMVWLAVASLVVWVVWIAKAIQLHLVRSNLRRANTDVANVMILDAAATALSSRGGIAARLVGAMQDEMQRAGPHPNPDTLRAVLDLRVDDVKRRLQQDSRSGLGLLATVGATAPFIGLFGTVWGIMNSFIGISKSQTTNLAVVAPGIAEALLATAIGLVAAIPAVILYNNLGRRAAACRVEFEELSSGLLRTVVRQFGRSGIIAMPHRAAAE